MLLTRKAIYKKTLNLARNKNYALSSFHAYIIHFPTISEYYNKTSSFRKVKDNVWTKTEFQQLSPTVRKIFEFFYIALYLVYYRSVLYISYAKP